MRARSMLVFALTALAGPTSFAQEIHGRVLGPDGAPASGVRFARLWSFPDPADAKGKPKVWGEDDAHHALTSDERGEFSGPAPAERWVFALDGTGRLGALFPLDPAKLQEPLEVELSPLVEVRGRYQLLSAGERPKTTGFFVGTPMTDFAQVALCLSESHSFHVWLPPGEYSTWCSNDTVNLYASSQLREEPLVVEAGKEVLDLGSFDLQIPLIGHPSGVVLDREGRPVPGAEISESWGARKYGEWALFRQSGFQADEAGRFRGNVELYGEPKPMLLLALDALREHGAFATWDPAKPDEPLEFRLQPTIRVHGRFATAETRVTPSWTNVYISAAVGQAQGGESKTRDARILSCQSTEGSFDFRLPPGTYQFNGYGTDTLSVKKELRPTAEQGELDLGLVELPQTVIARNIGKPALPWKLTDARGLAKDAQLADFRGKWVVLEFWGYW